MPIREVAVHFKSAAMPSKEEAVHFKWLEMPSDVVIKAEALRLAENSGGTQWRPLWR